MSSAVEIKSESGISQELGARLPDQPITGKDGRVEKWLESRTNPLVYGVIAAAFLLRVYAAGRSFLNPDEVLHYIIFNQRSVYWAYRMSLTNAHPPLIYLLLYYWRFLGRSELMLRFPSVVAGTVFCWVAYKWIGIIFGRVAGLMGLVLTAFLPVMINLSAEVRSYALLLCFETAALYLMELALQEKSVRKMWYFSVCLYLAILSHYSAIFFVLGVGLYALVRIVESELPRKVIAAWAEGQAGALAIYVFLYVTHLSKLKQYISIWQVSFDETYSHSGREHFFTFVRERTVDIFAFVLENHHVTQVMAVLWIVALSVLLRREWEYRRKNLSGRHAGILMFVPWIAVFGAGIAGVYPYVGSRHTVFLAPFLIAALCFLFANIFRQKLWAALVIAALLVGAASASGRLSEPYIAKENQSRALMTSGLNYVRQTIPPGEEIITDYQSALLLVYYLCGPELILPSGAFNLPASRVKCNGYKIASYQAWGMQAPFFLSDFGKIAHAQHLTPGDKFWVFQTGWGVTLGRELPLASAQFRCLNPKTFGANISIFQLAVAPDFSPMGTETNCTAPATQSPQRID